MAPRKGNTNARTHGLYAKHFTPVERADLGKMDFDDLRQEIAMLRVVIAQIFEMLKPTPPTVPITEEAPAKPIGADDLAKLTNSLTNAVTTLATLTRTNAILSGDYNPLNDALLTALTKMPAYEKDE